MIIGFCVELASSRFSLRKRTLSVPSRIMLLNVNVRSEVASISCPSDFRRVYYVNVKTALR